MRSRDRTGVKLPPRRRQPARPRRPVEETADDRKQFRLVEQEGVVPLVGGDFSKRDARARGIKRVHDGARFSASEKASRW